MMWFKRLLGRYTDYKECGVWGCHNTETGESKVMGKMFSRTIKVVKDDGTVGLDHEWITDETMQSEKQTGVMDGPASI